MLTPVQSGRSRVRASSSIYVCWYDRMADSHVLFMRRGGQCRNSGQGGRYGTPLPADQSDEKMVTRRRQFFEVSRIWGQRMRELVCSLGLSLCRETTKETNGLQKFLLPLRLPRPPLWPSGQSSWQRIQRSAFDFRCYQTFWELVDLELGST
jgi:hypothetical protein